MMHARVAYEIAQSRNPQSTEAIVHDISKNIAEVATNGNYEIFLDNSCLGISPLKVKKILEDKGYQVDFTDNLVTISWKMEKEESEDD